MSGDQNDHDDYLAEQCNDTAFFKAAHRRDLIERAAIAIAASRWDIDESYANCASESVEMAAILADELERREVADG